MGDVLALLFAIDDSVDLALSPVDSVDNTAGTVGLNALKNVKTAAFMQA